MRTLSAKLPASWATAITVAVACALFSWQAIFAAEKTSLPPGVRLIEKGPPGRLSEYRLANGLTVLLCERHAVPVVSSMVVYRIGSRNEAVGYTGATHFLEHLMFKGTEKYDPLKHSGVDDLLKPIGGTNNASTSYDRTNYYEIVPAKDLELCLRIESDRMRHLLLRKSDRDAEMTVVRNEMERDEDDPQDFLDQNIYAQAFQAHPYHHPVIGWRSDVENMPLSRLRRFYDEFYWPDNAQLILIGDFDSGKALQLIAKWFGQIPKSPKTYPRVYTVEPPQQGERRFTITKGDALPRVMMGFHVPNAADKDTYPFEVLESILGDQSKESSRLYKRLIDTGLASEVSASHQDSRDPGLFILYAAATANTPPEKLEQALRAELNDVKAKGVTQAEVDRAKSSIIKHGKLIDADPQGMAEQLAEAIAAVNWQWWRDYPKHIQTVTPEDVKRVAEKYLITSNETVGYLLPKTYEKPKEVSTTSGFVAGMNDVSPAIKVTPVSGKGKVSSRVTTAVFPNGLTLLVMTVKGTDTVAVAGKIKAGKYFNTSDKRQLAMFVADDLTTGSAHYSKQALSEELDQMGASFDIESDTFFPSFVTQVVTDDLPRLLPLIADVLMSPTFPEEELKKSKDLRIARIQEMKDDTANVAWINMIRSLYKPNTPYWEKNLDELLAEVPTITRDDLVSFTRDHYTPANTVITMVGDITAQEAIKLIDKNFGSWQGAAASKIELSEKTLVNPTPEKELKVNLPEKSNTDIYIGVPADVSLKSPDYFATLIANAALGYDSFTGRLAPVRDKYGLTYSISSYLSDSSLRLAPWIINYSVNPENLAKANELVKKITSDYIKNGMTEKELAEEKTHIEGNYFVDMRSPRQIARRLAEYAILGVSPEYIDNYRANLQKVTLKEANEAIRKHFRLEKSTTSIAGTLRP